MTDRHVPIQPKICKFSRSFFSFEIKSALYYFFRARRVHFGKSKPFLAKVSLIILLKEKNENLRHLSRRQKLANGPR